MRVHDLVEFYQPYVSLNAPPSWQHKEVAFQILFPLLLALLASMPLVVARYWGYAMLSIGVFFVVLHTVRAFRNWLIAYPNAEGMMYISPSNSGGSFILLLMTMILAACAFLATPYPYQ